MEQPRINTLADLFSAGTKVSAGANTHSVALGLTVGTKVLIDGDLNLLGLAFDAHRAGKEELKDLRILLRSNQDATYEFNFAARDSLKRTLGRRYSSAWEGSGFSNSLEVPRSVPRLQLVTRSLQAYLADHPAYEVPDAVTAVLAQASLDALTNAQTAVDVQESAVGTLLAARRAKEKKLRLRLRWVIDELSRVLDPLDDRWTAFGFNKPGLQQTPDRPGKVSVILKDNDSASVKWARAARAEYYRVWIKVLGLHQDPIPVGSPADLDFTIESLPAGSQIEIGVTAINNGGESAMSEVVKVTTV